MSFGWQGLALGLVVGFVGAIATMVVAALQNRHQHQQVNLYPRNNPEPRQQRNLTCALCGRSLQNPCERLSCGHNCHKSCYRQRNVPNNRCSFCRENNEEENELIAGLSQRSPPPLLQTTVNSSVNTENDRAESSTRKRRKSSTGDECAYCKVPLGESSDVITMDCQHRAHDDCFKSLSEFANCMPCCVKNL